MEVYVKYSKGYEGIQDKVDYLLDSVLKGTIIKEKMTVFLKTNMITNPSIYYF